MWLTCEHVCICERTCTCSPCFGSALVYLTFSSLRASTHTRVQTRLLVILVLAQHCSCEHVCTCASTCSCSLCFGVYLVYWTFFGLRASTWACVKARALVHLVFAKHWYIWRSVAYVRAHVHVCRHVHLFPLFLPCTGIFYVLWLTCEHVCTCAIMCTCSPWFGAALVYLTFSGLRGARVQAQCTCSPCFGSALVY